MHDHAAAKERGRVGGDRAHGQELHGDLAETARLYGYCRPVLHDDLVSIIFTATSESLSVSRARSTPRRRSAGMT